MIVGEVAEFTLTVKEDGANEDPTALTFTVQDPSGNPTNPTVSNPSTGVYTASVTLDEAGKWRWRFVGTGTAAGAAQGIIEATASLI